MGALWKGVPFFGAPGNSFDDFLLESLGLPLALPFSKAVVLFYFDDCGRFFAIKFHSYPIGSM